MRQMQIWMWFRRYICLEFYFSIMGHFSSVFWLDIFSCMIRVAGKQPRLIYSRDVLLLKCPPSSVTWLVAFLGVEGKRYVIFLANKWYMGVGVPLWCPQSLAPRMQSQGRKACLLTFPPVLLHPQTVDDLHSALFFHPLIFFSEQSICKFTFP